MNAKNDLREHLKTCERLLIGIGEEWKRPEAEVIPAYDSLYRLTEGKDFFIVTTVTDGRIFKSGIDPARIVAPRQRQLAAVPGRLHQRHLGAGRGSGRRLPTLRRAADTQHRGGGALHRGGLSSPVAGSTPAGWRGR